MTSAICLGITSLAWVVNTGGFQRTTLVFVLVPFHTDSGLMRSGPWNIIKQKLDKSLHTGACPLETFALGTLSHCVKRSGDCRRNEVDRKRCLAKTQLFQPCQPSTRCVGEDRQFSLSRYNMEQNDPAEFRTGIKKKDTNFGGSLLRTRVLWCAIGPEAL